MAKQQILIWHCTATPEGREVTADEIRDWHLRGRGWKQVGYRGIVHLDGSFEILVPFDQNKIIDPWEITNGVKGINGIAAHYVYAGGTDKNGRPKNTVTPEQFDAMADITRYDVLLNPELKVGGHNQFSSKACPSFDVPEFCREIHLEEKNIYKP